MTDLYERYEAGLGLKLMIPEVNLTLHSMYDFANTGTAQLIYVIQIHMHAK